VVVPRQGRSWFNLRHAGDESAARTALTTDEQLPANVTRLAIGRIIPVLPAEFRLIDDEGSQLAHRTR
jgi:hypothetical protein